MNCRIAHEPFSDVLYLHYWYISFIVTLFISYQMSVRRIIDFIFLILNGIVELPLEGVFMALVFKDWKQLKTSGW